MADAIARVNTFFVAIAHFLRRGARGAILRGPSIDRSADWLEAARPIDRWAGWLEAARPIEIEG
jgi:hypothetical protein